MLSKQCEQAMCVFQDLSLDYFVDFGNALALNMKGYTNVDTLLRTHFLQNGALHIVSSAFSFLEKF